ncbi:MAG: glycosyltransferase family 2 protein [Spongiibacteraceae bacterium]|jgi:glycosyltransferase involved in cell wall biosynthesis|nr:glycosyltransferase family 2 protein [Spongiibacteraceae bacterium]
MTTRDGLVIIVPVKDEEDNIAPFLRAVFSELSQLELDLSILFVDDGSADGTLARIQQAAAGDSRIHWLSLSRNFGKEAAMTAGLDHADGAAVVLMDVDLQHPPALIHEFVRRWREGYDMVYAVRADRGDSTAGKRGTASLFYRVFNRLSQLDIPANAGDFRLLDRRVVAAVRQLPERNRFMKGLFAWPGFRSIGVPFASAPREAGESKFSYWRLWNFALDGFVSFSTWPLRVWSYIGAGVALLSFIYAAIIVADVLVRGRDVPGYASMMTAILFLGGMQLISIGVLGEYIGRLFTEVKGRPIYIVRDASHTLPLRQSDAHDY